MKIGLGGKSLRMHVRACPPVSLIVKIEAKLEIMAWITRRPKAICLDVLAIDEYGRVIQGAIVIHEVPMCEQPDGPLGCVNQSS